MERYEAAPPADPALTVLQLLATGGPAACFDDLLLDAVGRGASTAELATLRAAVDLARTAGAVLAPGLPPAAAPAAQDTVRLRRAAARARHLHAVHDELTAAVLNGGDVHGVVRHAAGALGGDLLVRDPAGRALAGAGSVAALDQLAAESVPSAPHTDGRASVPSAGVRTAAITAGGRPRGVLLLRTDRALDESEEWFLRAVAQTVGLLALLADRSTAVAEGPLRDELFEDLLAGPARSARQLGERARRLGIDPGAPYVVLVARPEGGEQGKAIVWASSYAYRMAGLKSQHGDCISLLVPGSDASAAARAVSGELAPLLGHPVSVGAAGPAAGLDAVAGLHREAVRCLDVLIALDGAGSTASTEDLGFVGLLLAEDNDIGGFIDSALGPVLQYDNERFTDLARTLEVYFAAGGSPTRAAETLHVHANTVSRRLERIGELLGPGWQKPERGLEIQLALRLLRTQDVLHRQRAARPGAAGMPGNPRGEHGLTPDGRHI
ncbi:PucR family transcriptional regulator [Kitasatospora sp. NBC_01539]|uniref:PucR family transcriptional regulator n=1 Tax=Kitasatospora sp. NBC_01539 TaxID=2903577 RepID=UPI0038602388